VNVVSKKAIRGFTERHPDARSPLMYWLKIARKAQWSSLAGLKAEFPSADWVDPNIVFNVGGNKYRLIAEVNFRVKVLSIRHILTHRDYDRGAWKK
jgi:mRNA interferase HigB